MNKSEFLSELRNGLSGLPQDEVEARVAFYNEMIDDRMEEGMTEEEAVSGMDPIETIVSQTLSEIPMTKLVKEKIAPKRKMRGWETALIVLGAPLWLPLLIAAVCVLFSLYIVLWSLLVSLWAIEVSFAACVPLCAASAVVSFTKAETLPALGMLGAGLFFLGFAILFFFACVSASKGMVGITKKLTLKIKSVFVRKDKIK